MEIGRKIIHLESIDSTNNYTANLLKSGQIDSGTVILADEQFAGKGQRSAVWLAKAGENLTFSVFLGEVNLSVLRQFELSKLIAVSIHSFLEGIGVSAKIKWPNDIIVNDQKIAGVLIENTLQGSTIKHSIIGIGVNVNQQNFGELSATSIALETNKTSSLTELLMSYIYRLNKTMESFPVNSKVLNTVYHEQLYRINEWTDFIDNQGQFTGKIVGVEPDGKLQIERKDGKRNGYELKEVRFSDF